MNKRYKFKGIKNNPYSWNNFNMRMNNKDKSCKNKLIKYKISRTKLYCSNKNYQN
jgi:hypothetical protein